MPQPEQVMAQMELERNHFQEPVQVMGQAPAWWVLPDEGCLVECPVEWHTYGNSHCSVPSTQGTALF